MQLEGQILCEQHDLVAASNQVLSALMGPGASSLVGWLWLRDTHP